MIVGFGSKGGGTLQDLKTHHVCACGALAVREEINSRTRHFACMNMGVMVLDDHGSSM